MKKSFLLAATLILSVVAFQRSAETSLRAADPLVSFAAYEDFFPTEDGARWSGGRSAIAFRAPAAKEPVRVELVVSGWRPPGFDAPTLTVSAGGRTLTKQIDARAQTISLETTTGGPWRSDLLVDLRADTFSPGSGDERNLGIKIEEARLIRTTGGLVMPPIDALLIAAVLVFLVRFLAGCLGARDGSAAAAGIMTALLVSAGYAFYRPVAGAFLGPLALVLAILAVCARVSPPAAVFVGRVLSESVRAGRAGLGRAAEPFAVAVLLIALVAVALAYRSVRGLDIDLGSGREVGVARNFGAFEGKGGFTSRRPQRGAVLDLSDFGGGTEWRITASAAIDGASRAVPVLRVAGRDLTMSLEENTRTEGSLAVTAPVGWASGLAIDIPDAALQQLRLDRVTVERDGAVPSVRIALAIGVTAVLILVLFGAAGASPLVGRIASAIVAVCSGFAIASEPLAAIPFTFRFLSIVTVATALAAFTRGLVACLDDGRRTLPTNEAVATAACGWISWLTAMAFPFYRGGHFAFHSSIAEEIWKGRFMIYYLPFPGSTLSEQAQWGKIVMPHPALWQTLVSPLSALPKPWFYLAEKIVLATFFASLVLVASMVARRVAGDRASVLAAVVFTGLVPTFQLLGLGHLMTTVGVFASSLAMAWLMFRIDALKDRRTWLLTVGLFTFCFLSYTAALLFTGAALTFLILVHARSDRSRARSIFGMTAAASVLAFLLYYMNWAVPFLAQSVPKIMGGAGLGGKAAEATPVFARLALEPGKLSYSYGSMLIPVAGTIGLALLKRGWDRRLLLTWIGILYFVSSIDLFFNFLLKHHYYVALPVAVGVGVLLARTEERFGRNVARVLTLLVMIPGVQIALDVALGRIP